jgi:1,4-alpha-glucan branching enzyme
MLYLDYARKPGEWLPNARGGRENLDAIDFLRQLNTTTYATFPGGQTIAEESTAWPKVSRPVSDDGLGFGMKWDMGWMHDTLHYMSVDPLFRSGEHRRLTFRGMYAFNENFVLPLSHDEVVRGQGSLLARMFGDRAQKFANLRLLLGYMYSQPGKKLLFMGDEFGQAGEWNHDATLDWHELASPANQGLQRYVEDLNRLYRDTSALYQQDFDPHGFEWIDADNVDLSVLTYLRRGRNANDVVVVACNFTPVLRTNFRLGVPFAGVWNEVMNSDAAIYGGDGNGNFGAVESAPVPANGRSNSLSVILPPLAAVFFTYAGEPSGHTDLKR